MAISARILDSQVYSVQSGEDYTRHDIYRRDCFSKLTLHRAKQRIVTVVGLRASVAATPPPIVKTFARFVPERL
jgi:hypothetical protein